MEDLNGEADIIRSQLLERRGDKTSLESELEMAHQTLIEKREIRNKTNEMCGSANMVC